MRTRWLHSFSTHMVSGQAQLLYMAVRWLRVQGWVEQIGSSSVQKQLDANSKNGE
jgi:hypothetical protein